MQSDAQRFAARRIQRRDPRVELRLDEVATERRKLVDRVQGLLRSREALHARENIQDRMSRRARAARLHEHARRTLGEAGSFEPALVKAAKTLGGRGGVQLRERSRDGGDMGLQRGP
jgi:hypothetical protein